MKKLLILFTFLLSFMITMGATPKFTFEGYEPESAPVVKVKDVLNRVNGNNIAHPRLSAKNPKATKAIQKTISNYVDKMAGSKKERYEVSYDITTNNNKLVSILFTVDEKNLETSTVSRYYEAFTFDAITGKNLKLGDVMQSGYEKSLGSVVNDKVLQLSIPVNSNFDGLDKKQQYYIQKSAIVFFYTPYQYTDFADGQIFLPFELTDLRGLWK